MADHPGLGRRTFLTGLVAGTAVAAGALLCPRRLTAQPPAGAVALPDFRAAGARDDNAALAGALATGRPVYLPAGRGTASDGAYLIETGVEADNLVGGASLSGDGIGRTVIRRPHRAGSFIFFVNSGSPDPARNRAGIRLADMTLEDDVVRLGFSEHHHLMHLNGVTGLQLDRVAFRGFRGDGLYLGSGHVLGMERHNRTIAIRRCGCSC